MRILIVNGYPKHHTEKFEKYKSFIKEVYPHTMIILDIKVFMKQKELLDTETEFYVRDASNIDDFLFEGDSGFSNRPAARNFDFIDLVFIEISNNIRPWSKQAFKLLTLIRMCMRTNKIVFGSSAAIQAIVFLVATNFESAVQVINGEQGGSLGDLRSIQKPIKEIKKNEIFLDNVTGDIYKMHYDEKNDEVTWVPVANAGIHQRKAAEEYRKIGQFLIKAPVYKPQNLKEVPTLYTSTADEKICNLKKNQIHHYLLKGLPQQFITLSKQSWDVHAFNIVNPQKTFKILAESDRGPQIIEVNSNVVGVQFEISKKYPETCQVFKNFVLFHLNRIRSMEHQSISIIQANNELRQKQLDLENMKSEVYKTEESQFAKLKFNILTKFHHAGYAAKQAQKLGIVQNNAIGENILAQTDPQQKRVRISTVKSAISFQSKRLDTVVSETSKKTQRINNFNKTGCEIRQMLHPELPETGLPANQPLWVPGDLKLEKKTRPQSSVTFATKSTRLMSAKSQISRNSKQIMPDYDECRQKPIVRCSSPYVTLAESQRREQMQKDKLILAHKTMRTNMDKPNFIKNILHEDPYLPPNAIQFRSEQKEKWLSDQNFII